MELYKINTNLPVEGCCESIGGRPENQDSYGYQETPFGLLVVVCDGMGGGPAGKMASTIAVNEIIAGVMEADKEQATDQVLLEAIRRANRTLLHKVADNPKLQGMGTTCAVVLINAQSAWVAHVGDSRVYQLRGHRKVFRTFDHSVVFEMVKQKVITEEQARLSDQSNVITRALGLTENVEIDLTERAYCKGDRFMLTSDGIHGTMPEPELIRHATRRGPLDRTVDELAQYVDHEGHAHGGGHDNLTLIITETKSHSKLREGMKNKTTLVLSVIAALLAATLLALNSCQNKDIDVETFSIEAEQVQPGIDTVGIRGTYDFFMEAEGMKINIGQDSTLSDVASHAVALTGKDYAVTVRNLQPATTYYYGYSVNLGLKRDFITETRHFTTLALPPVQRYTVSVTAQPAEGGTATGGGTFEAGQQCTLRAHANEGFDFVNWTENDTLVSTDTLLIFRVERDRSLVAHFEPQAPEYTIAVSANPSNGGTVNGGGIYEAGQNCTVRATANEGYTFVNWTENGEQVSANANYTFTVNANRTLLANFEADTPTPPEEYTITVSANPSNGGTVTGGGTYEAGQNCTVRATANEGYTFVNWTENGEQVSANANYTFAVSGNRTLVANFTASSYVIAATVDPENSGTIRGTGGYEYGQSCTLRATANTGYTFVNWTENGNVVSTSANYTFNVTESRNLVAHFDTQSYTISVSAQPPIGGVATGGGTYHFGNSCTVRATANSGYTFTNWTENGSVVSTNANYTFTVNGNRTLVANFTQQAPTNYTITVSANPTAGGTVNGGGTYQQGQSCTVRAVANNGYTFTNWTENGSVVSTNANYSFTVNGNRTLVANFTQQAPTNYTITVSANPTAGGTVTGGGTYQQGQSCTVRAVANNGYSFTNWTENGSVVSSNANYTFTVNGNRTLVAHFQQQAPTTYTITVSANPTAGGTVTGGGTYQQGQSCTVRAVANNGYTFTNWTENGNVVSTNANYSFTVTANRTLVANFTAQPQNYVITLSANPNNGGTLAGGGTYQEGEQCTVSASANSGYAFTNWTENGNVVSTNANYSFTVNGNRTLVANFTALPQNYTITVSANPSNGGSVSGGGIYQEGQSCTVTANANTGYEFSNWTENGSVVSTNANYSFTVNGNRTLVANFTALPQNYTITVSANPSNGGSVSGGGTYQEGQSCTVNATANTGYEFTNWTENGNVVSMNTSYTFTVTGNRSLVANFTIPASLPTVITVEVTNITHYGAVGKGNVTNNGGTSVTERGICWSTSHNPTNSGNHITCGVGTGIYSGNITGLSSNTTYYVRAYAINSQGVSYGDELSFATTSIPQPPTGAIAGLFSVSATNQVWFSQGNLQYKASTNTWRFGINQYDFVGNSTQGNVYEGGVKCNNSMISSTYNGWIDLFGWGTSGWNSGAVCYQPWSTSANSSDYYVGGSYYNNLTGSYANADWGVYNTISNGGNQPALWRTLSYDEFYYLIYTRDGANQKKGLATVDNVHGAVILPDNWVLPQGCSFTATSQDYTTNTYTTSQWQTLENAGAVFFPASGQRVNTSVVEIGEKGMYWSSTYHNDEYSSFFQFSTYGIGTGHGSRSAGHAIRLVQDCNP